MVAGITRLPDIVNDLAARQVQSILLECGPNLAFDALERGLIDKIVAFVAPRILGGREIPAIGGVGAMAGASGAFPEDDFIELSGRGCSCGIAGQRGVSRAGLAAVFLGLAWARRARRRACVEGRRGSAA